MRPRYGRRLASSSGKDDGLAGDHRSPARPSLTDIDGELRADRDRGAAGAACWRGRQDHGMEEQGIADLSAPYAGCRCLDRVGLSWRAPIRAVSAVRSRHCLLKAIGKDVVSRVWRRVKSDWDAWNARSLAEEPIVRLILDGTVVRVRLDRKATSISLLVVIGVRADGQKMLLAIKSMGGESDGSLARGPRRPDQAWSAATAVPHRRRRAGIGEGACRRLGGRTGTAMHRAQTQESARPRARAPA